MSSTTVTNPTAFTKTPASSQQLQHHSTGYARWLSNAYILFVLVVLITETVPADLCPHFHRDWINPVHEQYIMPITHSLGIWQVPWTMFSPDMDDQNEKYEARIRFVNGSQTMWKSPTWADKTWYERARCMRPMNYWEKLEYSRFAWRPLAEHLARQYSSKHQQDVDWIELYFLWERVPHDVAEHLPLFVPCRQKLNTGIDHLYTWRNPKYLRQRPNVMVDEEEEEEEDEDEDDESSDDYDDDEDEDAEEESGEDDVEDDYPRYGRNGNDEL